MTKEWPIIVRFTVTAEERHQVAEHYGKTGMASLADMRRFLTDSAYADLGEVGMDPLSMYDNA